MEKKQLRFKPIQKEEKYELAEDYIYSINGYCITVPKGFLTDLASIPLPFRIFFPKDGDYTPAAVVHDYLYSEHNNTGINREYADKIFNFIMKELGISTYKRKTMYRAVRLFGEPFWKNKQGYKKQAIVDNTDCSIQYKKEMRKKLGKL